MAKRKTENDRKTKISERKAPEKAIPEKTIEELKRRAEELTGGHMEIGGLDDCPAEVEEGFWKYVVDYEEAPWTTNFQQLEDAGVALPSPDSLKDEELTAKLWEIIQKLAFLMCLSNRQIISATANSIPICGPIPCGKKQRHCRWLRMLRATSNCSAVAATKITCST